MTSASALQCHGDGDGDGRGLRRGSDELGAGPRQGDRTISFGARQRSGERESRKGKERLESCNAQTATKTCHVSGDLLA